MSNYVCSSLNHPMDNFYDFADLEAEVYDWQDDMLIPATDDGESETNFLQYINSNYDF